MIRYTYEDMKALEMMVNIIEFDDEVLNIINSIATKVGSSNYVKTPVFTKTKKQMPKPVIIESDKVSTLKKIQLILNKISKTSYVKLKDEMLSLIDDVNKLEKEISINEISEKIFETASIQKINANIYADLYEELINLYPSFQEDCTRYCNSRINIFDDIKIRNPNTNYEEFCKDNLQNDKIRSLCLFYVELCKRSIIKMDYLTDILNLLLKKINDSENIDFNDENPCSEYIENIFIIITNMYNLLKVDDKWVDIYNKLKTIKNQDKNKNKNITSKIKFKIMDIIDFVENKI